MSVEENKAVVRRFFEEVFNQQQPEALEELLADSVVDHNKIIFTEPNAPAAWRKASGGCSLRFSISRRA